MNYRYVKIRHARKVTLEKSHIFFGNNIPHAPLSEGATTEDIDAYALVAGSGSFPNSDRAGTTGALAVIVDPYGVSPGIFVPRPLDAATLLRIVNDVQAKRYLSWTDHGLGIVAEEEGNEEAAAGKTAIVEEGGKAYAVYEE